MQSDAPYKTESSILIFLDQALLNILQNAIEFSYPNSDIEADIKETVSGLLKTRGIPIPSC